MNKNLLILFSILFTHLSYAQCIVVGGDTIVNSITANNQMNPAVSADSTSGTYFMVWESFSSSSVYNIYGRTLNSNGSALGSDFLIGNQTNGRFPDIAESPTGDVAIVWSSDGTDGDGHGIYGRLASADGTLDATFRANSTTTKNQKFPSVGMADNGDYVVVWASEDQDGDDFGIVGRRYNANSSAKGSEFIINDITAGFQSYPDVAVARDGSFVVTWQSNGTDGSGNGVYARRYNSSGIALGNQFLVNSTTSGNQQEPTVAVRGNGDFGIVWSSYDQDGHEYGVFAQFYDSLGAVEKAEFQVNTLTDGNQGHADIASTPAGRYLITYTNDTTQASKEGVYLAVYELNGTSLFTPKMINDRTTDYQEFSAVAAHNEHAWMVAYQDGAYGSTSTIDGSDYGIVSKIIGPPSETIYPDVCDSYTSPSGLVKTASEVFTDTVKNAQNCDSFITVNLTIRSKAFVTINPDVCNSYTSPSGKIWTTSNTYLDTIPNAAGCDSIITVNLTIRNKTFATINPEVCYSYTSPSGKVWTTSNTYQDTIPNAANCDSIITVNLTIRNKTYATINPDVCYSYTSPSGKIWTASNRYLDTIPNAAGCDSIITVNLTIRNKTFATINPDVCNSYNSPSGKTWTASNTYLDTIPNAANCDSIITVNLIIRNKTFATINPDVCYSYTSPSGKVWTTSNTYQDTIPNAALCDSIITVNLTVRTKTFATITPDICDRYTSPSGKVWTSSNTYLDTIPNAALCDSIITVNLTVRSKTDTLITIHSCDSFVSASGKKWFTTGTYMDTIPNVAGCDSLLTYHLTIYSSPALTLSSPAGLCVDAGLQVYNNTASPAGGVYSGSGVTDDGNGMSFTFDPSGAGAGRNALSYTVAFGVGCSTSVTDTLEVFRLPDVDLSIAKEYCSSEGRQVGLSGGTPLGGVYSGMHILDSGDGARFTYDASIGGISVLTYTYTDSNSCTSSHIDTITSRKVAISNFTLNPPIGCAIPHTVFFKDQSTLPDTWFWEFGDGNTSTVQNPVHNYTTTGDFTVRLTVTDTIFGCSQSDSSLVKVNRPIADIGGSIYGYFGCAPLNVNFVDGSSNSGTDSIVSYLWNFGNGDTSSQKSPSYTYDKPGVYTVSLTVTNSSGCTSTVTEPAFVQAIGPDVNFGVDTTFELCDSTLSVNFTDSTIFGAPITNWNWNFGDGFSSNLQNPSHTYSGKGIYGVSLTIHDIDGCSRTMTQDSLIEIRAYKTYSTISADTCDTYTSPSGKIWTHSGIYSDTLTNSLSCDSIITVNLTIRNSTSSVQNITATNMYTSPSGIVKTESEVFNDTIPNVALCDSVMTINLTVLYNPIYVDSAGLSVGQGSGWGSPFNSLQGAFDYAMLYEVDTIYIAEGTYFPTERLDGSGDTTDKGYYTLHLADSSVVICGGINPATGLVEGKSKMCGNLGGGDTSYHVFATTGLDSNTVISNFIICDGKSSGTDTSNYNGNDYYNNFGAGMYNFNSSPKLVDVDIVN
ncbi:MAG: PKD domain-containing protein, partial [Bacteroidia bacterium]